MTLTRRHVMGAMGAGALLGWPHAGRTATEMTLGTARLTTLSDGHLTLPRDFMLGDLDPEKAAPILAEHGITGDMLEPPCNLTLYRDGTNTVLFDAGSGSGFMPSAGELRGALDAAGSRPTTSRMCFSPMAIPITSGGCSTISTSWSSRTRPT